MIRKFTLLFSTITLIIVGVTFAQGTESFTNIPTTTTSSYTVRTWTGDNGLTWNATDARTDQTITGKAIAIRVGNVNCQAIPNGIGSLTFTHKQVFTGSNPVLDVYIGSTKVGTVSPTTTATTTTISNINVSGSFNLEIRQVTSGLRIAIDDVSWTSYSAIPCVAPTAQPTAFILSSAINSISGSFTAASPAANSYLVVRSTSNSLGATPVDGTNYTLGQALGNGVVINNNATTSFTDVSLTASTTYYYFVFSFNNISCSGGPLYLATSELNGNATTLAIPNCITPATPTNLIFTSAATSITGNFTGSGANKYLVIQTTVTPFTGSVVNGSTYAVNSSIGNGTVVSYASGTNFTATGLTSLTSYYYFIFAANDACLGEPFYNSTALTGTTTTTDNSAPVGYYDAAIGLTCAPLKTALSTIIATGHTANNYGGLDDVAMLTTDDRLNDAGTTTIVYDMYSDNPTGPEPYEFSFAQFAIGSGSDGEGNGWNKEHSFPNSWFSASSSTNNMPGADLNHIFPTDMDVNSLRGNFPFGKVATATTTTMNGSKLGNSAISFAGYAGPVFEPIDAYKGDFARATLYMVTRYQADQATWENYQATGDVVMDGTTYPSVEIDYLKMLIDWHNLDPVSIKEIERNDAVYGIQNNRNPFIDHPEYVGEIWSISCGLALPIQLTSFDAQLVSKVVQLKWTAENPDGFSHFVVERSVDGINFRAIGNVYVSNTTNYNYTDNDLPQASTVFYRLKLVDFDHKFSNSKIVSVKLNAQFSKALVYPNPVNQNLQIKLYEPLYSNSTLQITDATGSIALTQTVSTGNIQINTNVAALAAGKYFVLIRNSKQIIRASFVVIK